MSATTFQEIRREFFRSKMGIAGLCILAILASTSVVALVAIPLDTLQQWNNPEKWIEYPRAAVPSWVNLFTAEKIPEHQILESPAVQQSTDGGISVTSHRFQVQFGYDDFPDDFIYEFSAEYVGSPLMQVSVIRPDGVELELISRSLPQSDAMTSHSGRIFSTDSQIRQNLNLHAEPFGFDIRHAPVSDTIFSQTQENVPLKGNYVFSMNFYGVGSDAVEVSESKLIIGGKAFGVMGTDELRRDLAVGLLWGTPLALFIGLVVSIASVVMGLLYGVYAGFRGKKTDETMMRVNDVVYALPALPFLVILSVTVSNSIFVMVGFLMIFGWVGIAKVSRSMSLQIKTRGYVDAAEIMGQKRSSIIFKHILPQLLPYAFASIAISVPAAITTEAGLSFLGLGDPSFPTWGQILHDANTFGASPRGLWWWIMPPGIMIAITGLAFVFIGNALDTIANPRLRR